MDQLTNHKTQSTSEWRSGDTPGMALSLSAMVMVARCYQGSEHLSKIVFCEQRVSWIWWCIVWVNWMFGQGKLDIELLCLSGMGWVWNCFVGAEDGLMSANEKQELFWVDAYRTKKISWWGITGLFVCLDWLGCVRTFWPVSCLLFVCLSWCHLT